MYSIFNISSIFKSKFSFPISHSPFSSIGFVSQLKASPALVMRRQESSGSVALLEDRNLLAEIWQMSSVIIAHYSLLKLTATEVLHVTEEVRHQSNQLQTLLRISEQQLGRLKENYFALQSSSTIDKVGPINYIKMTFSQLPE